MKPIKVTDGIFKLTIDIKDILFEQMWYLPHGVALNSYIVKGDKVAIIDGFCGWDGVPEQLFELLAKMDLTIEEMDYIIINHMEPDHSGWLEEVIKLKPDVKILCTKMASDLLNAFFGISENIQVVKAGDSIDLGNGKVLKFLPQPNVHWPDTMFTLEKSTKTLFTCDMFGTYGVCAGKEFDDQFKKDDEELFYEEAIRYYSNILATYSNFAQKAINNIKALDIAIIAPGHGPVWHKNPNKIIDYYSQFAEWSTNGGRDEILLLWGSMYGMTEKAVQHLTKELETKKIKYTALRVPETPIGTIISYAFRSKGIVIAAPTYENHLFPAMATAFEEMLQKKILHKKALYVGSFGWNSKAYGDIEAIAERNASNWEFLEPITFRGAPSQENLENLSKTITNLL